MNFFWKKSPFLRLLFPFFIGIIAYLFFPNISFLVLISCISVLFILLLTTRFFSLKTKFQQKESIGILLNLLLISVGYFSSYSNSVTNSKIWYKHDSPNYQYALVRINNEIETKPKSLKALVEIKQLVSNTETKECKGEAIIYFQKNEKSASLKEGDYLLIKNKFQSIQNTNNPGSFNYANYCNLKNIYESAYITEFEFQPTGENTKTLSTYFNLWNYKTRTVLNQYISDSSAKGIAEALLIGYRKNVDDDIWQSYSNTGIVHVIAISGMHMAMIYSTIIWLLFRIPFFKRKNNYVYLIAIFAMWLFACLTGLPPSVTRSAIMFTFIGIAALVKRDMNIYNNLAASAFCLLCYNPYWLVDVGFQLSYLAILSMLLFFEKFYHLLYFSNYWVDKIWAMIAGTLSAQVLTFPILIYYFHQFPLLFIITNLIAIPMTGLILYGEIVLILFSWIKPIAKILGFCISKTILFLNYLVLKISQLSFVTWSSIQVNEFQVLLLFIFISCLGIWVYYKQTKYLISSLVSFFVFMISVLYFQMIYLNQQKMVVYSLPKKSAIGFVNGKEIFLTNDSISKGDEKFTFTPSKIFFQATETKNNFVEKEINNEVQLYQFKQKTIAVVHSSKIKTKEPINVDFLIIGRNCLPTQDWIEQNFISKQIIVENTIPFWKMYELKENLKEINTPVYFVSDNGAYVVDL